MSIVQGFVIKLLVSINLLIAISLSSARAASIPPVKHGRLDLTLVDLSKSGPINLDGEWEFYWNQILYPADFIGNQEKPDYINVPSVWNGQRIGGKTLTGEGYATYRLIIRKDAKPELLSMAIPNVYTSYSLWVNGTKLASNGMVATEAKRAKPQWEPQVKVFEVKGQTIELILQVSNFHHDRGGVHKSLKLGLPEIIISERENIVVANMLMVGGLLILGAFFIGFFLIRRGQLATLYFGLLCVFWSIRSLFSNIYLVTSFFHNISWTLAIRMEYLTLYFSMMAGMLFISEVFPLTKKPIFKYLVVAINYCIIALTILLPPAFFTQLLPAYQFFIAVNFLYAIVIIVGAILNKQREAWFSAISIIIGIGMFTYELTAYALVVKINTMLLCIGYLLVFFLNSLVLAYHFVGAYKQIHVMEKQKKEHLERRLRGA